jgi:Sulfotransferase family
MQIPIEIPPQLRSQRVMLVFAPAVRCGTTLIQRLLNSTRQIVVFGENSNLVHAVPQLVFNWLRIHTEQGAELAETRRRFVEETAEFWTSGLLPDTAAYAARTVAYFYDLLLVYQRSAEQMGFSRWGLKQPLEALTPLDTLRQLLPAARSVFIYRDLFACARSAKGRKFLAGPDACAAFAARWQDNLLGALSRQGREDLLLIKYEELVADPKPTLARLEAFAETPGIDPATMERRINTFEGLSPTGYVQPAELDDAEAAALAAAGAEGLRAAGYAPKA